MPGAGEKSRLQLTQLVRISFNFFYSLGVSGKKSKIYASGYCFFTKFGYKIRKQFFVT